MATALPENFTPDMVSESAKETCLNWFYKVASIRELLPRLYVEIAILKSYSFLDLGDIKQTLERLTKTIRGIGDPLVAAYARCYLCRVGMTVTGDREYIKNNLHDFLFVYHTVHRIESRPHRRCSFVFIFFQIFSGGIRSEIVRQQMDLNGYLTLYTPCLDWLMQSTSGGTDILLDEILTRCQEKKNKLSTPHFHRMDCFKKNFVVRFSGLLLNSILTSFKPSFIAARAEKFVSIISNSATEGITKAQLFRSFGQCLSQCPPSAEQKSSVLIGSWKTVSTFTQVAEYITCVEPWSQYIAINFDVSIVCGHVKSDVICEQPQQLSFMNFAE